GTEGRRGVCAGGREEKAGGGAGKRPRPTPHRGGAPPPPRGGGGGGGGAKENQYPRWLSVQNHLVGMYRRSNASERDRCEQIRPTPSESYGRHCVLIA